VHSQQPAARPSPRSITLLATPEWAFAILRALAMLGGMVALFLAPVRPEHQPHIAPLAWTFVAYKLVLFLAIRTWPERLRQILPGTVGLDLMFVSLFVWFSGGLESHFYLLYYLLVGLTAVYFSPGIALGTAGAAGLLYGVFSLLGESAGDWHHLIARSATFFLLAGSLGYISQRERVARARVEDLNRALEDRQARLERAYRELQAAQERLVQSERLATIGQMAAKVSHEVRNPLGSISLNAELLEDELRSLPEARRTEAAALLAVIRSQVDALGAVTEEYLRFARLPKPKLEPTALGPLLEELGEFVRGELQTRGVHPIVDVPEGLPALHLDSGQMRQALLNLIRNATEAMPDGGTLRVTVRHSSAESRRNGDPEKRGTGDPAAPTRRFPDSPIRHEGEFVEISVTDTGLGIPAEDMERIFEPFFSTKESGTGLGLAIARQIAVDHGGSLTCESGPGIGTTFRLSLPARAEEGIP
jgi:signal transduction histidine kinase